MKQRARILFLVAIATVLVATLWPFNPLPRNGVTWLRGTSGLRFEKAGLVISREPLTWAENEVQSYSLELLLRPASTNSQSRRTILAFYEPDRSRQFMICQWTDGLIVTHDANTSSDKTRTVKFDVEHAFRAGTLVLVTISSGPDGTTAFLDGQPVGSFPRFRIVRGELSGEIIFGTSPTAYYPWQGEVKGVAIYAKELRAAETLRHYRAWSDPNPDPPDLDAAVARYTFAEASGHRIRNELVHEPELEIPSTFSIPHKPFLLSARREFYAEWTYVDDLLLNITGFIPLGLIVCTYFNWKRSPGKALLITVTVCGFLSFSIELLQYYVPRRVSGTTDIITNTVGATIGALLTRSSLARCLLLRMKLIPVVDQSGSDLIR